MTIGLLLFNAMMCYLNCAYGFEALTKDGTWYKVSVYVHFIVAFGSFIAILMMIHLLLMGIG